MNCPLMLDGWLEFNRVKWGVTPLRFRSSSEGELPAVSAVLYLDRKGSITMPKRNPYLPVIFEPTEAKKQSRIFGQWLDEAKVVVDEMRERGLAKRIVINPEVSDVRPWQTAGFLAGVRYTFFIDFPFDMQNTRSSVRKNIAKASRAGYRVDRTTNMEHVVAVLKETEARQGFTHGLNVEDLQLLQELLGGDHFRAYTCYSPDAELASVRVVLHIPGGRTVDWVAGTGIDHLQSGATQLTIQYVLQDLENAGATGFDFGGANIPSIAAAKMTWGGRLVPFYTVEPYNLRSLARWGLAFWRYRRNGRG